MMIYLVFLLLAFSTEESGRVMTCWDSCLNGCIAMGGIITAECVAQCKCPCDIQCKETCNRYQLGPECHVGCGCLESMPIITPFGETDPQDLFEDYLPPTIVPVQYKQQAQRNQMKNQYQMMSQNTPGQLQNPTSPIISFKHKISDDEEIPTHESTNYKMDRNTQNIQTNNRKRETEKQLVKNRNKLTQSNIPMQNQELNNEVPDFTNTQNNNVIQPKLKTEYVEEPQIKELNSNQVIHQNTHYQPQNKYVEPLEKPYLNQQNKIPVKERQREVIAGQNIPIENNGNMENENEIPLENSNINYPNSAPINEKVKKSKKQLQNLNQPIVKGKKMPYQEISTVEPIEIMDQNEEIAPNPLSPQLTADPEMNYPPQNLKKMKAPNPQRNIVSTNPIIENPNKFSRYPNTEIEPPEIVNPNEEMNTNPINPPLIPDPDMNYPQQIPKKTKTPKSKKYIEGQNPILESPNKVGYYPNTEIEPPEIVNPNEEMNTNPLNHPLIPDPEMNYPQQNNKKMKAPKYKRYIGRQYPILNNSEEVGYINPYTKLPLGKQTPIEPLPPNYRMNAQRNTNPNIIQEEINYNQEPYEGIYMEQNQVGAIADGLGLEDESVFNEIANQPYKQNIPFSKQSQIPGNVKQHKVPKNQKPIPVEEELGYYSEVQETIPINQRSRNMGNAYPATMAPENDFVNSEMTLNPLSQEEIYTTEPIPYEEQILQQTHQRLHKYQQNRQAPQMTIQQMKCQQCLRRKYYAYGFVEVNCDLECPTMNFNNSQNNVILPPSSSPSTMSVPLVTPTQNLPLRTETVPNTIQPTPQISASGSLTPQGPTTLPGHPHPHEHPISHNISNTPTTTLNTTNLLASTDNMSGIWNLGTYATLIILVAILISSIVILCKKFRKGRNYSKKTSFVGSSYVTQV